MQFIRDIHAAKKAAGKPVISFEFFPPKTDEGDRNLLEKTIPPGHWLASLSGLGLVGWGVALLTAVA